MKMIIAYIQPFMETRVMNALHGMEEVSGVTFRSAVSRAYEDVVKELASLTVCPVVSFTSMM